MGDKGKVFFMHCKGLKRNSLFKALFINNLTILSPFASKYNSLNEDWFEYTDQLKG